MIGFSEEETAEVLTDLARMQVELRRSIPAAETPAPSIAGALTEKRAVPAEEKPTPVPGKPSLFLDERLARARVAASGLGRELHRVEEDSHGLRESIDRLEGDLDEAVEELAFIRANDWAPDPHARSRGAGPPPGALTSVSPIAGPDRPAGVPQRTRAPPQRPSGGTPFEAFTSERYNATVVDLHRRWPRVVWITLGLSAAISLLLEAVILLSREPFPGWWLALLPVIWMLPVPFFVAAFRGTHRVLRESPLRLSGGS
ncbi:MAG: hypothetical protein L3K07_04080 [Thermoplasmata archaeon]|nr:hypothetical protein [Thermoplasmata archaeon]